MTFYGDLICEGKFASFGEYARFAYYRGLLGIPRSQHGNVVAFLEERYVGHRRRSQAHLEKMVACLATTEARTDESLREEVAEVDTDYYFDFQGEHDVELADYDVELADYLARKDPLSAMYNAASKWQAHETLKYIKCYLMDEAGAEDKPRAPNPDPDNKVRTVAAYRAHLIESCRLDIKYSEGVLEREAKEHADVLRDVALFEKSITEYEKAQS